MLLLVIKVQRVHAMRKDVRVASRVQREDGFSLKCFRFERDS